MSTSYTRHGHAQPYPDGLTGGAIAHPTHAQAYLSARVRIAPLRAGWRAPQRQRDAKTAPPACPLKAALPQRRRRGRVLRALLAAAGRAQRHVLLIYEEQALLALGGVPPCPHWPRVHTRSSAAGVDASIESAGYRRSDGKGGAAGRCAHRRNAHHARIAQEAAPFGAGCRSTISGSSSWT